jgi:hypothetical protein
MILSMLFGGGGASPYEHKSGSPTNYASAEFRESQRAWLRKQGAKAPGGVYHTGWNRSAILAGGTGTSQGTPQYTRKTYPLGKPSQEFYDKYSKWGEQGPQGNTGWVGTLTKAPPSQSTSAQTQTFKQEVFQTRETRNASGIQPFKVLHQHTQSSRLNPNLAYMYKAKNTQLGAVRRTVTRFL